jgi:diketogulonate reductase-like aldo/keto reductase
MAIVQIHFNLPSDQKERAEAAAKYAGVTLSAWCRLALRAASDKQLEQARTAQRKAKA